MAHGFQQTGTNSHVMKSGDPSNAFRFAAQSQDTQESRTNFNDSNSSDAKAKLHSIRGQAHAVPHQGKGNKAKAATSVGGRKMIPGGTGVS